jgi:hypothetical protein
VGSCEDEDQARAIDPLILEGNVCDDNVSGDEIPDEQANEDSSAPHRGAVGVHGQ